MGLNELTDKIRATHPGAYDDMDDATLTKKVLSKYPQYSDLAAPKVAAPLPSALQGKPSFEERAAGRFEQNVRAPAQMLDMAPKAISEGIQQAQRGNFQMTDRGKAEAFPFGQQNLARKIAGLATMPQRQVYGQAKDLIQAWRQDPANAVGDVATAALPLADAKLPPNAAYAARGATAEAGPTAGSLLRQELASRIPLAKRFGVHGVTIDQLIDLMKGKAAAPEAPVPTGPPSMWGKMIDTAVPGESIADWWKRTGRVMAEERPGGRAIRGRQTPTPSPTTPPPTAPEPDMEMLRRQAGIRPEPAAPSAENTFMGELAKKKPVNLSELEAAGAKHETRTVEKAALERPKTEAERIQQEAARRGQPPTATSGPKADLLEDKGIMERMRASMEADRVKAAQEYRANNTITTTKGELIEKAGTVKYTTTPPAPAKVDLNNPSTLQDLLKKSVKQAKAKRGK